MINLKTKKKSKTMSANLPSSSENGDSEDNEGPTIDEQIQSAKTTEEVAQLLERIEIADGDGGDSDEEGEELEIHEEAMTLAMIGRHENEDNFMATESISSGNIGFVVGNEDVLESTPTDILDNLPKTPSDWQRPAKRDPNEPDFEDVDNPGGWSEYVFRPVYRKEGRGNTATYHYIRHELPTGATVVPKNEEGKRKQGDWEFFIMVGFWTENISGVMMQKLIICFRKRGGVCWMSIC